MNRAKRVIGKIICVLFITSLALGSYGKAGKGERVKLSGKVTQIKKVNGKWVGKITFSGTNNQGVKYKGTGTVEITFGRQKKVVRKMKMSFQGTRDNKAINGTMESKRRITFANPVESKFEFSNLSFGGASKGGGTNV